jgi:hypothetical protein
MTEHLNQAQHNWDFLNALNTHFPKLYFDWKITVTFYVAIHYLRAFEKYKGVRIHGTHRELIYHSDPAHTDALNPLSHTAFLAYLGLFDAAHKSRYKGFGDKNFHMTLLQLDYNNAQEYLSILKTYIVGQGLKLP